MTSAVPLRAICSAIGVTSVLSCGAGSYVPSSFLGRQAASEYTGPWQPRSSAWLNCAAGVASVISAVETLPVAKPAALACSISVAVFFSYESTPMAALYVLTPEDQAVAELAESVTSAGFWLPFSTAYVATAPVNGRDSMVSLPPGP